MSTAKHEKQTNGVTDWERAEVQRANSSGLSPVVFVHGLWLLPSSWESWRKLFEDNGYITLAPGWPDDPRTREQAYANPEVFAGKSVQDVTDHYLAVISELNHQTGGDRAFLRRADRAEDRRRGRRSGHRGHRQRPDQRGAAAAAQRAQSPGRRCCAIRPTVTRPSL